MRRGRLLVLGVMSRDISGGCDMAFKIFISGVEDLWRLLFGLRDGWFDRLTMEALVILARDERVFRIE
jgi:hypothetical protein